MEYFNQDNSNSRITGHIEIKPIDNVNCHEYIQELTSLPYLHSDIKKTMEFLIGRIKELENKFECYSCQSKDLNPTEYKCNSCNHEGYY